jgi:glycine/serine hydroxymethyltransferase
MKEGEMREVAQLIHSVLKSPNDALAKKKTREKVKKLTSGFEIYPNLVKI